MKKKKKLKYIYDKDRNSVLEFNNELGDYLQFILLMRVHSTKTKLHEAGQALATVLNLKEV